MLKTDLSDPGLIALSTLIYRLLLTFYPVRFRREYGPHMAQVFRDYCMKTHRQSGIPGMLVLWARTLYDWFKTVIEEQLNRETEMTREKFIRLSGWGMILGAITLMLGFLADASTVRGWMYSLLGSPETQEGFELYRTVSDSVGGWLGFAGLLLLMAGITGLRLRYGKLAGPFGNTSLLLSIISGGIAAIAMVSSIFIEWDGWWNTLWFGIASLLAFLALFGVAALRAKPMPRWNGLPVLAGVGFPWLTVIALLFQTVDGNWWQPPGWLLNGMWLMTISGLVLLGYVLQGDAPQEQADGQIPRSQEKV